MNRRQASKNAAACARVAEQAQPQEPPPQQAPPSPPAQEEDVITQLVRLGALHAQGILTDEEFAAQKPKMLGL